MTIRPALRASMLALLALAGSGALAQFKLVDPEGRVTYTDRPPVPSAGVQVTSVRPSSATAATPPADTTLPLELRQAVARFPVTLYTMSDCSLCDSARKQLRGRGIPHSEKLVDDAGGDELVRLTGGRTVPSLTIGSQVMRGFAETDWHATLDLAGYPRESKLPRSYVQAAATPLVTRPTPTAPVVAPTPEPRAQAEPPATEPPAEPSGPSIRF